MTDSRRQRDIDGGWAWMVVAGGVLLFAVLGGSERAFGILYVELLDRYRGSAAITAWVGGIASAVRFITGPIGTSLCERFSFRAVVIAGGIIRASGFIIASFAPDIVFLCITYGLLVGFGGGLVFATTLVIVAKYFDKKRGLATGMCTAGAGIGTLIYPYLYQFLLREYGYRGTMWIVGALTLNMCVSGALFRKPSKRINEVIENGILAAGDVCDDCKEIPLVEFKGNNKLSITTSAEQLEKDDTHPFHNVDNAETHCLSRDMQLETQEKVTNGGNHPVQDETRDGSVIVALLPEKHTMTNGTADKKLTTDGAAMTKPHKPPTGFQKIFDYKLLANVSFVLFTISITFGTITTISTVVFIPSIVREHGMDALAVASLVSAIGITDIFARVLFGAFYDIPVIRRRRQVWYSAIFFLCGLTSLSLAFVRQFVLLAVNAVLFGLASSSVISQRSVILVDLVGNDRLSTAMGLATFLQGFGILVGQPFAGFLKDEFRSYAVCFYFTGTVSLLGSSILAFEYWIRRGRKRVC